VKKSNQLLRHWTKKEIGEIHNLPFLDLLLQAQTVHRANHDPNKVQLCTLLSIKTGGCPEDCAYCPQSARYKTDIDAEAFLDPENVLKVAQQAHRNGSTRFCMGAAWRSVSEGRQFEQILEIVKRVAGLGMEVCCSLGMLTRNQAQRLAQAGLTAYNHNLDTGPEYYSKIITTRTYADRLRTLQHVRSSGVTVCCGGIIGMGETAKNRFSLLEVLSHLSPHPESVPINSLVRVKGTPLANRPKLDPIDLVRMIATTRIVLPTSMVRLSAGRTEMSMETQALCFMGGANSIFTGEKLLTTPNPGEKHDQQLLKKLGLSRLES